MISYPYRVPVGKSLTHRSLAAWYLFLFASISSANAATAAEPHEAFLTKYCITCHGPDHQESELRVDLLSRDFELGGEAHRWAELIERVNAGDMPPEGEPRPTQDEIETFVTRVDSLIREGRAARMAARPAVAHYRLSRKEYQNVDDSDDIESIVAEAQENQYGVRGIVRAVALSELMRKR